MVSCPLSSGKYNFDPLMDLKETLLQKERVRMLIPLIAVRLLVEIKISKLRILIRIKAIQRYLKRLEPLEV